MKLEAFSQVSNLVRHLEGLQALKERLETVRGDVSSYVVELRSQNDGVYTCHAYMQSHDADAPFTAEELIDLLQVRLSGKIEYTKAQLRDLGIVLDGEDFVMKGCTVDNKAEGHTARVKMSAGGSIVAIGDE